MGATPAIKRIATLLLGIGLIGLGALFFLAPEKSVVTQLLIRYWPTFLVLAGLVRFAGYLIDREPRSPVGALLLTALGGILLSARLLGHASFLLILSKYWFWVLLAFIAGRVLRQYLHRSQDGPRRNAFSPGGVLIMILIAGSGLLAAVVTRNDRYLQNLNARLQRFGQIGGILLGENFTFTEPDRTLPLTGNARLSFAEFPGEIMITVRDAPRENRIVATAQETATLTLTKHLRAENETQAAEQAESIRLQIDSQGDVHRIGLQTPEGVALNRAILRIEIPQNRAVGIDARSVRGEVRLVGLRGDHAFQNCNSVAVLENTGRVTIENPAGRQELNAIRGEVTIRDSRASFDMRDIRGAVQIEAHSGAVTAQNLTGPIRIQAGSARISLTGVGPETPTGAPERLVQIENADDGRIELQQIRGGVSIASARTRIEATEIAGDLTIAGTRDRILAQRITGALRIVAREGGSVESEEIRGPAVIEASRNIVARNFQGPLTLRSETGAIEAETGRKLAGDLELVSGRGRIALSLPEDTAFQLDAQTGRGRIRLDGFPNFAAERNEIAVKTGVNGARPAPRVSLRLDRGDIQLQSSGLALASNEDRAR